jgi:hypothetical protein
MQVPMIVDNTNAVLLSVQDSRRVTPGFESDILDPPSFNYAQGQTMNNVSLTSGALGSLVAATGTALPFVGIVPVRSAEYVLNIKPVKFQVRVLVCCGLPPDEALASNYVRYCSGGNTNTTTNTNTNTSGGAASRHNERNIQQNLRYATESIKMLQYFLLYPKRF